MSGKEVLYINPEKLFISGIDTESDASNDPLFDERIFLDTNENLVRNIMKYGVQMPVLVRVDGQRVFVVDGRQRVRAARIAAQRQDEAGEVRLKVPVIQVSGDDQRVQGIMISTNENRADDDVLVKALKASRLMDLWGDIDEICTAFGRTRMTINSWLKLAAAVPVVHDAIKAGKISSSIGIEIASLPRGEQEAELKVRLEAKVRPASQATSDDPTTKAPRKAQPGVKRAWVKAAMETESFKKLNDDQQSVLTWMATGSADPGTWMDEFEWGVAAELKQIADLKSAKSAEKEESDSKKEAKKAEREAKKAAKNDKREARAAKKAAKAAKLAEREERRAAALAAGKKLPGRPKKNAAGSDSDSDSDSSSGSSGDASGDAALAAALGQSFGVRSLASSSPVTDEDDVDDVDDVDDADDADDDADGEDLDSEE